jgi:hypothetical protein
VLLKFFKRQLKTHLLALALGASVQVFSLGFKCLGRVFKGRVKHVRSKRPLRTHMWSLRRCLAGGAALLCLLVQKYTC